MEADHRAAVDAEFLALVVDVSQEVVRAVFPDRLCLGITGYALGALAPEGYYALPVQYVDALRHGFHYLGQDVRPNEVAHLQPVYAEADANAILSR